jgi:hypothetical protein
LEKARAGFSGMKEGVGEFNGTLGETKEKVKALDEAISK